MTGIRIGHGYDVHALVNDRRLIIGGVEIPFEKGLLGHSDADVLIHAVMDALIGAIGKGDIGKHFPDSDPKYKDISSINLLLKVKKMLDEMDADVVNIDATIVMQRPKISQFIDRMKENIAFCLGIDAARVNLKATTEERLGFTGREEGVAAHAVALIEIKK